MKTSPEIASTPAMTMAGRSRSQVFLKWTLLVTLNALFSFIAALLTDHTSFGDIAAMLLGIFTFICAYSYLELRARARNHERFLKSLKTGVIVKMVLQLIPGVEIGAGFAADSFVGLFELHRGFFRTYLMTDVVGILLSVFVFLITAIVMYVGDLIRLRKNRGK